MLRLRISAVVCAIALLFGLLGWAVWRPADQAMAATNGTVNFQARLQTAAGNLVPDGFYNVEFKLYNTVSSAGSSQGSCAGDSNCLWVETRTGGNQVRVVNGYLTVNLGSVNAFGSINWDQELWLTMNVGGTGSPTWDGEMTPRLKLTAVPYAFRAGQLALQTGVNTSTLGWANQTAPNNILLPDEAGTICLQSASSCGFVPGTDADFIQNQNGIDQTANFRISGTGRANALQALTLDTATAAALSLGVANATSITIGGTSNTPLILQSGEGDIDIASTTGAINIESTGSSVALQGDSIAVSSGNSLDVTASNYNFYTSGSHLWQSVEYNGTTAWRLLNNQAGNAYFAFQNYNGQNILHIDGENDTVRLGQAFGNSSGSLLFHGSDTGNEITLQASDTFDSYSLTLPTALGGAGDCLKQQDGVGQLVFTACGAESGTLQGAYNASVGGATPEIKLNGAQGALDIQDADSTIGGTLFNVRGSNGGDLGEAFFSVDSDGNVGIGTDTQERTLDLVVNNSVANTPPFRILQEGSGDASMEFATTINSFFAGIDTSKSGAFVINSSTAASGSSDEDVGFTSTDNLQGPTNATAGDIWATRVTTGASGGNVSSISWYVGTPGPNPNGQVAIYADNGGAPAEPGALIASSGTQTLSAGWNVFPISATLSGSTSYWIARNVEDSTQQHYISGGGSSWYCESSTFGTWIDPADASCAAQSSDADPFPLYMTIDSGGSITDSFDGALFSLSQSGALTLHNSEDSAGAFQVQNVSGEDVLRIDTDSGQVVLGDASTLNGVLVLQNAGNSSTVTLQTGITASSYTLTLPTALGASGDCLVDTDGSGVLGFANCDNGAAFIQGGNDFDGTAVLGTTDSDSLEFLTNNNAVLTLSGINGAATFQNSADSASALRVSNFAGNSVLTVDTESGHVLLGAPGALSGRLVLGGSSGGTTTLQADNSGADHFVTLPNASGTVCLTSGNCSGVGGNGDILQGGNSFGSPVIIGTNQNHNLELETNNVTRVTIDTSGNVGIGAASSGHRLSVSSSISGSLTEIVNDDFDPSIDDAEWSSITNGSASTACGAGSAVSGNPLRFTEGGIRSAATINMDTSAGGTISFYLYADDDDFPCNSPESGNEDIVLEYSNNNGADWTTIDIFDADSYDPIAQETLSIPAGAQTASTQFRWRQEGHSGGSNDQWTLDNVVVSVASPEPAAIHAYNNSSYGFADLLRLSSDVGGVNNIKFRVYTNGDVAADGTFFGAGGVTTGAADLAEVYRNNDNAQPGDVVVFTDSRTVEKASAAYQTGLAGVVSTRPGFTLNVNESGVPVALSGRVPVKVSIENGIIQKGDYLTSGPDGKAQKATAAGPTIGTALEDAAEDGTIEVFVHLGYYDPVDDALFNTNVLLTLQSSDVTVGNLNVSGEIITDTLRVSGNAYIGGELEVGVAKVTSTLTVGGRIISKGKAVTSQALPALGYSEQELSAVPDPPVVADGTDTAGTITFTAGNNPANGELLRIAFSSPYEASPRIVLEPSNAEGAQLQTYITKTNDGFTVNVIAPPEAGKTYSFDYVIIGSEAVSSGL